ncbi:MAG TPA: hypothetical protein VEQ38_25565 [Verrucomicrobiae bacterium]|nr:hypothetical protein [Verrucomicrobiae bacterium]
MKNDPFDVIEKYRKSAAEKRAITAADVLRVFSGSRVQEKAELIGRQVAPCPIGPVIVASDLPIFGAEYLFIGDRRIGCRQVRSTIAVPCVTIVDPAKFVPATLAELTSFISAKNSGRHGLWIENIVDEKIEQLRLCGVEAEIRAA